MISFFHRSSSATHRAFADATVLVYCLPFVFLLMTAGLSVPSAAFAQQDSAAEIQKLQDELTRLKSLIKDPGEPNLQAGEDKRVWAVDAQRTKRRITEPLEDEWQIRMYDLSDLFVVSPPYPTSLPHVQFNHPSRLGGNGGGGFGGGGGVFRLPPEPAIAPPKSLQGEGGQGVELVDSQISVKRLTDAIKHTVSPGKWGTKEDSAKIESLGNALLITATPEMHTQIINVLNLFREHWGRRRTISVQTFWVRGSKTDAKQLIDTTAQEKTGAGVVSAKAFDDYLKEAETGNRIVFTAMLTGHNNQTLHTLSGKTSTMTTDGKAIVNRTKRIRFDDDGEETTDRETKVIGFHPIRSSVFEGPVFQVTPQATRGGNFVILDMHAKLTKLAKQVEAAPDNPSNAKIRIAGDKNIPELVLDSTAQLNAQFSSTIRCPKEEVILAGAMTAISDDESDAPNLLIFVKTTIHTIVEDKSDWHRAPEGK